MELHLSVFGLCYRITRWKGYIKYYSASLGVDTIVSFMALTLTGAAWLPIAISQPMEPNKWLFAPAIVVGLVNDFYLRRHGLEFEIQFHSFSKRKQIALYLAAAGIILVTGIAFAIVGTEYRQMFPSPGK